ncbi:hypothetical protein V5N11_000655 [Cardamine amara subsp. amara]|uniref:Ataxin-10 domain-containing protein n=1 Tax=Cardamine amara subsp. amara TaxID=228776 RepID=A0ABD1B9P4_CARAN
MEASIPEQVLQPLLHASDLSFSLEDCLKFLLESSRTDSGRSDLASKAILPSVLRLLQLLPYPSSRHYLNLSLKLLRNLCAGDISNQNAFIDHNGSALVSHLLSSAIAEKITDFETVRFGLQVLSNVVLFGEKRQRDVWLRFFPEWFFSIAKIRRRETCDPLCKILYTCFDGSPELSSHLCSNEGLCIIAETLRTSSSVGSVEDYWLKLLVSRICVEEDYFHKLFSKLYTDDKNETFTKEQAFLLRMVSDIANERIGQVSIPKNATHSILGLFKQSVTVFDFVSSEKSELPTGSATMDVMGYSLVIIRDACAGGSLEEFKKDKNDSGDTVVGLLLSSGLIEILLDLLRELEPPTTIKKSLNQSHSSSSSSLKPCPYRGFRRDIVSVIANCAYRRKEVQDEMKERDGLFLMLQQCVTDDDNPFLREWGLWCVRNLLEGNEENQKAVAELEIQDSVDVPQLREIGLRVEIDPKTARPKLVNDT